MTRIKVRKLCKTFILHLQRELHLPILGDVDMDVDAGECVVIHAPSGMGKSTLLRCLYANYRASSGSVSVRHGEEWGNLSAASAQKVHAVRQTNLGFVMQFLRVIPRISTLVPPANGDSALSWARQTWCEAVRIPAKYLPAELARAGLLDVLSSDDVPASLLHAVFLLQREGFSLPKSMAAVSRNPACSIAARSPPHCVPTSRGYVWSVLFPKSAK